MFLTWQARVFGLTRRSAFLITICLCGDVILFARALRSGWIIWWLLSIVFIIILGVLWPKVLKTKKKDNVLDPKMNVFISEKSVKEEIITQIQANVFPTERTEIQEKFCNLTQIEKQSEDNSSSIDELIEHGFEEKYFDNFERAAYFFFRALSLDPKPDLAFYLIMDCYWLWNNLGEHDYALTQLHAYIQKYSPQFNPEIRHQFDDWMTRENLYKAE